jgi:hypothetical protein
MQLRARQVDAADAYRECEEITRRQARNFLYGIRLLRRITADPLTITRSRIALPPRAKAWVAVRALVGRTG